MSASNVFTIAVLGRRAAGKGSALQRFIAERLRWHRRGWVHVSSGDLFRDNLRRGTKLGLLAKKYMDAGKYVPDSVTIAMVIARLQELVGKNVILDGVPRTVRQAKLLRKLLPELYRELNVVINFDLDEVTATARALGRRVCTGKDQHIFHVMFDPTTREDGKCDKCGAELVIRKDDNSASLETNMKEFAKKTEPMIQFYRKLDMLLTVDAKLPMLKAYRQFKKYLQPYL